jgi:hypothetical protein
MREPEDKSMQKTKLLKQSCTLLVLLVAALLYNCSKEPTVKRPGKKQISFVCIDQFGAPVDSVSISLYPDNIFAPRNETTFETSDTLAAWLKITADRPGYRFLSPDSIHFDGKRGNRYVLQFFKGIKIAIQARQNVAKNIMEASVEPVVDALLFLESDTLGRTDTTGQFTGYYYKMADGNFRLTVRNGTARRSQKLNLKKKQSDVSVPPFVFQLYKTVEIEIHAKELSSGNKRVPLPGVSVSCDGFELGETDENGILVTNIKIPKESEKEFKGEKIFKGVPYSTSATRRIRLDENYPIEMVMNLPPFN